ncbi:MAG TPA: AMP-binding protein [Gemmataceae bacterium]|nr:AMP-binding protein [Gemmataceae bacterium]
MRPTTLQRERWDALVAEILPRNAFYASRFAGADPAEFARLPMTTKADLLHDQAAHPPYGTVLTYPRRDYCRLHQTSGTAGRPLRWLDTRASWDWMLRCWERMFAIIGLRPDDRLFFAFSFGPFLGFWTAFEAASRAGWFCVPGGGMSSGARLRLLLDNEATVLFCTPTYALRLAEVGREEGIDLPNSSVRAVVVAGEPGGSIPATRSRIEAGWGARVFDHSGMTEVGPMAIECPANPAGLHVLEDDYLAEVIDPASGEPVPAGQVGELVVTNLGRLGSPLIRYRTGDLVRVDPSPCPCGSGTLRLAGGILGRADDMIHLRGNNVYPGALEALLRRFPEVAEYRVEVDHSAALTALRVEVEPVNGGGAGLVERVDRAIRDEFLFRAEVRLVPPGSLPRFEMKARRFVVRR